MAQEFVKSIVFTQISTASINGATYTAINPNGLDQPCFMIRIINDNSNVILISFDGVNNNEYMLANSELLLATQTNNQPNAHKALWAKGTIVYVKGIAPMVAGNITLSGYYV